MRMKRITRLLVVGGILAAGCGNKKSSGGERAAVTPELELEEVGDDVDQLCLFASKHPGTPAEAAALAKVKAAHQRAVAELPARLAERKVEPHLAAMLDATVKAAAGNECKQRVIGVYADVKHGTALATAAAASGLKASELVKTAWPEKALELGEPIALALEEMSGGFLTAVTMSGPSALTFEVTIVPAGPVAVGELTTLPGIAGDVTMQVRGPDGKTEPVALPQLTLDPSGKIEVRQGSGVTADLDEAQSAEHAAMRQMASWLHASIYNLVGAVGLRPVGEPALEGFANYKITKATEVENTCDTGGPDVGEVSEADPIERMFGFGIGQGNAKVAGDTLTQSIRMLDRTCGKLQHTHLELTRKGDKLDGTYTFTGFATDACKPCVHKIQLEAEKVPPP
jgi:hypothetical protein